MCYASLRMTEPPIACIKIDSNNLDHFNRPTFIFIHIYIIFMIFIYIYISINYPYMCIHVNDFSYIYRIHIFNLSYIYGWFFIRCVRWKRHCDRLQESERKRGRVRKEEWECNVIDDKPERMIGKHQRGDWVMNGRVD